MSGGSDGSASTRPASSPPRTTTTRVDDHHDHDHHHDDPAAAPAQGRRRSPTFPTDGLSWGSNGPVLAAYQQRLKKLHFDPGAVDGVYGQDTDYAVTAVEKLLGLQRDGRIGPR